MEEKFTCEQCGNEYSEDEQYYVRDVAVCRECAVEYTTVCDCCDERVWNDNTENDGSMYLCSRCYSDNYIRCEDCNSFIRLDDCYYLEDDNDEEYPYCYECYNNKLKYQYIHEYSYKPEPIFHGESSRYFGVELEIDDGGKSSQNAKQLLDVANTDKQNIYIKSDGSLDSGMEIVTHPMTLKYHIRDMNWSDVLQTALDMGYKSHKTTTCGLHVHVNRNSLGLTTEEQDACISRILFFVERFWEELLKFSRRTESSIKRWVARYGYKNKPKDILDEAKSGYGGRYTCVNITNYSTIEFRIFRGTLKLNTLIATLQLVNKICDVAFSMSDAQIAELNWCDFVASIEEQELITYLKERRLYVNEVVDCQEDD